MTAAQVMILGATGDLTGRYLLPALAELVEAGCNASTQVSGGVRRGRVRVKLVRTRPVTHISSGHPKMKPRLLEQGGFMAGVEVLYRHRAQGSAETEDRFARDGVVVLGSAVPIQRIQSATRLLNLEIARHGIDPDQLLQWQQSTFFPHLRWNREVWDLLPSVAEGLIRRSGDDEWAEAQLLLKFPDEAESWPLEPHVDEVPPWASSRRYRGIIGVPLTSAAPEDGCLHVWPGSHRGIETSPVPVAVEPGDVVVMHPQLGHSGGLNRGSSIRMAVYFRLLAAGTA